MLQQAIEAELSDLMSYNSTETDAGGRQRLACQGLLLERKVMTGIGLVTVQIPRIRNRGAGIEKIKFSPSILLSFLHKAKSVTELVTLVETRKLGGAPAFIF